MALILSLETSTEVCSAALALNGKVLSLRETTDGKSHATMLTVYIEEMLKETGYTVNHLDAVAVSKGPGSYTGLRIGVSVAKGITYAANKKLIAVSSLQSMALWAAAEQTPQYSNPLFCAMIDARRMEVFTAFFDKQNNWFKPVSADIITEDSYSEELNKQPVLFFGNGAQKCAEVIKHPNAIFISNIYPSAKHMALLAEQAWQTNNFEDVAYFEPFYLKDFVATVSKKQLF